MRWELVSMLLNIPIISLVLLRDLTIHHHHALPPPESTKCIPLARFESNHNHINAVTIVL
jgi:hypothetical protein